MFGPCSVLLMSHRYQFTGAFRQKSFASLSQCLFLRSAENSRRSKEDVLNWLIAKYTGRSIEFRIYRAVVPSLKFPIDQTLTGPPKVNHVCEIKDFLKRQISDVPVTTRADVPSGGCSWNRHVKMPFDRGRTDPGWTVQDSVQISH